MLRCELQIIAVNVAMHFYSNEGYKNLNPLLLHKYLWTL